MEFVVGGPLCLWGVVEDFSTFVPKFKNEKNKYQMPGGGLLTRTLPQQQEGTSYRGNLDVNPISCFGDLSDSLNSLNSVNFCST